MPTSRKLPPSSAAAAAAPVRSPCTCIHLRRASRALTQLYDDAMAPSGLHLTQYALLNSIARHGTIRITALAAAQLLDRTALSRNLDPLLVRGLVAVTPGADARTREVTLTRAGEAARRAALPYWQQAQQQVESRIGRKKLDALVDVLNEIEALHPSTSDVLAALPSSGAGHVRH